MRDFHSKDDRFFTLALILSVTIHGVLITATGLIPSAPEVSVFEAPNSLEIDVIYQPLVSVIEEEIITEEAVRFQDQTEKQRFEGVISALQEKFSQIVKAEWERSRDALPLTESKQEKKLMLMLDAIVSRTLCDPIQFLKNPCSETQVRTIVDAFRLSLDSKEEITRTTKIKQDEKTP